MSVPFSCCESLGKYMHVELVCCSLNYNNNIILFCVCEKELIYQEQDQKGTNFLAAQNPTFGLSQSQIYLKQFSRRTESNEEE